MDDLNFFVVYRNNNINDFFERLQEVYTQIYEANCEVVGIFPNYLSSGDIEYVIVSRYKTNG